MTDLVFDGTADWHLICNLQELCTELFDPENLARNHREVDTILSAGWTLLKLKLAPVLTLREIDTRKLFDEFEEWFLGVKYTGLCEFEDFLKEVIK